jgi:hypothetical protein
VRVELTLADLQSAVEFTEPAALQDVTQNESRVLAFCLAFLQRESPDLARIVKRWNSLPSALRAGILAMVDCVK